MSQAEKSFWQHEPEYHGSLVESGSYRLAISPNGKRYLLQERGGEGFTVRHHRKRLHDLLPDLPQEIAAKVEGLPDDPTQYRRPWADAIEAQSLRLRRANYTRDEYAGVIATDGDVRLCFLVDRPRFALQHVDKFGVWRNVATSIGKSAIHCVLFSNLHESHRAAICCNRPALMSAVVRLPEYASQYAARRPEKLAQAAYLPRKVGTQPSARKRPPAARSGSKPSDR